MVNPVEKGCSFEDGIHVGFAGSIDESWSKEVSKLTWLTKLGGKGTSSAQGSFSTTCPGPEHGFIETHIQEGLDHFDGMCHPRNPT